MIEAKHIGDGKYEIKFDIQPLADKIGVTKEKLAEMLADEFMKIFGI